MSAPILRGWCPGAYRPMASGDGLVVRIRPPLGELSSSQAIGLADLARRYGHGIIQMTNRANLQIRGVAESDHAKMLDRLVALDLVPHDSRLDAQNIILDPLRASPSNDVQAKIAVALSEALHDPEPISLPAKFGFVVDTGAARRLGHISGDIRIEAHRDTLLVRADGCRMGRPVHSVTEAVSNALMLTRWFLETGGVNAEGRGRMADLIASGAVPPEPLRGTLPPNPAADPPLPGPTQNGYCVAAAFGQLTSDDLHFLADCGAPWMRLTPWRMMFLPIVELPMGFPRASTLIADPLQPLLRVDACPGAPACPQASVETRALARKLAPSLRPQETLHISGCGKGCARSRPADVTLVGRNGRFDLVRHGTAKDIPDVCSIAPDTVPDFIYR
ncbi:precorrin-3B synthase [Paracoccus sp. 11-3]|uniref:Precorrin-3B synthase n=1 Tax=Paracoccus amoyensis TaxID=2760093 RepID=A0A926GL20_9RHOB|nr:precorrin-3B synthase [Paracoccus amoyensis]MBC9245930.1 precorrin-3B synthase [Paracoccus amoyensis]